MRENETTTIRPGGHRLPELDGLRAWAITAVLFGHLGLALFVSGGVGVDLFFVLSGFLIMHLLLREYDQRGRMDLLAFYRRRAWRLLPALFAIGSGLAMALTRDGRITIPRWSRWLGWLSLPAMILLTVRVATSFSDHLTFSLWVVSLWSCSPVLSSSGA